MATPTIHWLLFDTPLGRCGVAWTSRGVRRVQLPERTAAGTRRLLISGLAGVARAASRPPAWLRPVLVRLARHLDGVPQDFGRVPVDLGDASELERSVWAAARRVPAGRTATYGEIARSVGRPGAARAVGGALGRNPVPLIVPCHRILAAGGAMGGFSAPGGTRTKRRLLRLEGAPGPSGLRSAAHREAARAALRRADPVLRRVIDRVGPCRPRWQRGGVFESLLEAIVYQQLTGKAAATIFARFRSLYPGKRFPSPAAVRATPERRLRAAGLSRGKVGYVRDLARRAERGELSLARLSRMGDEAVVRRLTAVRGVGRWTAQMFLIFRLGRADVLPVDDYGLRASVRRVYGMRGLPTAGRLERLAERWRPYRTAATWYLWRAGGPVLVGGV